MTTFVLIHGAYQGGWIWKPTVEQLLAKGHRVFAPTLDGCAERKGQVRAGITTESHAEEIANVLFYEDLKDVVLAGTSAWAIERCTMHPIATMTQPVKLDRFWDQSWNATVIWCKQSSNPPVAHQRRACETLKGRWHELDTGHYPMLSEPAALARLIAEG
jgi:pimeloyl-ACP methyl ester carboxylesterase